MDYSTCKNRLISADLFTGNPDCLFEHKRRKIEDTEYPMVFKCCDYTTSTCELTCYDRIAAYTEAVTAATSAYATAAAATASQQDDVDSAQEAVDSAQATFDGEVATGVGYAAFTVK